MKQYYEGSYPESEPDLAKEQSLRSLIILHPGDNAGMPEPRPRDVVPSCNKLDMTYLSGSVEAHGLREFITEIHRETRSPDFNSPPAYTHTHAVLTLDPHSKSWK